jgi:VIT1/CCC1 family predicted Fe2+/Mn2+ transporter
MTMNDSEQLASKGMDRLDHLLENQRRREFLRLQNQAERTSIAAGFLFALGAIVLVIGFLMSSGPEPGMAIFFGGGAVSLALVFMVVAQLIHIRAGLEKLNLK